MTEKRLKAARLKTENIIRQAFEAGLNAEDAGQLDHFDGWTDLDTIFAELEQPAWNAPPPNTGTSDGATSSPQPAK